MENIDTKNNLSSGSHALKELYHIKLALNATSIVSITNAAGIITDVNEKFCKISKYKREELIGKSHKILNSGHHTKKMFSNLWKTVQLGEIWKNEIKNKAKDGSFFWVDTTIVPFLDDNGIPYQYVVIRQDITDRKEMEESLRISEEKYRYLAYHDNLTGLANGLFLDENIQKLINSDKVFALFYIDLDRFKHINDTLGHHIGDQLLKQVAIRLQNLFNKDELLARNGGDEFIILIPYESTKTINNVADNIISELSFPFLIKNQELYVSPSIGISLYPLQGETPDSLKKKADIAMYQAKKSGGNTFMLYEHLQKNDFINSLLIENGLRNALIKEEFELYYQPKLNIQTNKLVGLEALIRWIHPNRGIIPPTEFIPVAEESGLIHNIGDWVINKACTQIKHLQSLLSYPLRVSVNISIRQFLQYDFVQIIKKALSETQLPPNLLEIEITESMAMHHMEYIVKIIDELKQMGLKIAIDDFGTGYSSLSSLKNLPIDIIKLDKSFIQDMLSSSYDLTLVKSIISLAHTLDLTVVAEGVETSEQLDLLKINHCDEIQGFYIGKPMTYNNLVSYLKQTDCLFIS